MGIRYEFYFPTYRGSETKRKHSDIITDGMSKYMKLVELEENKKEIKKVGLLST